MAVFSETLPMKSPRYFAHFERDSTLRNLESVLLFDFTHEKMNSSTLNRRVNVSTRGKSESDCLYEK